MRREEGRQRVGTDPGRNGQSPHSHIDQPRPPSGPGHPPPLPSQNSAQPHPQDPATAHTCSICLEEVQQERWKLVETNCGHLFCAQCILVHWEHDARYPRACLCPNCRRQVTVLLFSDDLRLRNHELFERVCAYNHRMSNAQGWFVSRLQDTPVLFRHLYHNFRVLTLWEQFSLIVLALAVIVYLLLPIDLIPELIFGLFGFFDDFAAVIWAIVFAAGLYRDHVVNADARNR